MHYLIPLFIKPLDTNGWLIHVFRINSSGRIINSTSSMKFLASVFAFSNYYSLWLPSYMWFSRKWKRYFILTPQLPQNETIPFTRRLRHTKRYPDSYQLNGYFWHLDQLKFKSVLFSHGFSLVKMFWRININNNHSSRQYDKRKGQRWIWYKSGVVNSWCEVGGK